METLMLNVKYGLRTLLKNRGFTIAAVAVLALGIGANSGIFSVVNSVLLRPLPYKDPARLVRVWHTPPQNAFPGVSLFSVSTANFIDWENQSHSFESMAMYSFARFNLAQGDQPDVVRAAAVSPNFFAVLGAKPMLGRVFLPEEYQPGHSHVIILGYDLWKNRFGASPGVAGEQVTLEHQTYTVLGVMDKSFRLPDFAQAWAPLIWTDAERSVRGEHHSMVIARLKKNSSIPQAQAEMDTISRRLERAYPEDDKGWGAVVLPLQQDLVRNVRPALLILLGAVAFVLLIACANVANLLLAKNLSRRKEMAIRSVLGASRGALVSQTLTETMLLALAGGLLGLLVSKFGVTLIVKFLASSLPQSTEIRLDLPVLLFTLGVALVTGLLAGLLPALRLTRHSRDLNAELKQGLGRTDAYSGGGRARSVLVASEVALSMVLLISAGLMIHSLWLLNRVNPGFDPHNVLTLDIIPPNEFPTPGEQTEFFDHVLRQVQALPGVAAAGVTDDLPLDSDGGSHQPIALEGRPSVTLAEQPEVNVRLISAGYLRSMRIPLLRGRDFSAADNAGAPGAVLVSDSLARQLWPDQDPIGRRLTTTFFPDKVRTVVGVIGDVKLDGLNVSEPSPTLYLPVGQLSTPGMGGWRSFPMVLVVRTIPEPTSLVSAVSAAIHQVDHDAPVVQISSMDDFVSGSLSQQRFNTLLFAAFSGLAVLLAAVGIYSVLAYAVRQRVREIGIRMALGAQMSDVLKQVVGDGMRPVLAGVALGIAGAVALGRVLASFIFGISATDPATYATVCLLLTGVALAACIVPAYRAAKVDPLEALRDE